MAGEQDSAKTLEELNIAYAHQTTCHGVFYMCTHRNRCLRVSWILLFSAFFIFASYNVSERIYNFFQFNTNTGVSTEFLSRIEFPAVTVCNFNRVQQSAVTEDDLFEIFVSSIFNSDINIDNLSFGNFTDYDEWVEFLENASETASFNYTEFTRRTGFVLDNETLLECTWRGEPCTAQNFTHVFTSFGNCWIFNSGADGNTVYQVQEGARSGLSMLIDIHQSEYTQEIEDGLDAGLKIQIHAQDAPPQIDTKGLAIAPGVHAYAAVDAHYVKNLEPPYGLCSRSVRLKHFDNYTVQGCQEECKIDAVLEQCGCRLVQFPGTTRECTPVESVTCGRRALADFLTNGFRDCTDMCPLQCEFPYYRTSLSYSAIPSESVANETMERWGIDANYIRRNVVMLSIYFEELVREVLTETEATTWTQLISQIGGQFGLFMGASLISFAEFLQFVGLTCTVCSRKRRKRDQAQSKKNQIENSSNGSQRFDLEGTTQLST